MRSRATLAGEALGIDDFLNVRIVRSQLSRHGRDEADDESLASWIRSLRGPSVVGSCRSGRGKAGRFGKCRAERTGLAEARGQSDLRHRERRIGQQNLRALDASAGVIAVRRHAKGLLEGPAEIVRAEPNQLRELGERDLVAKVLLDVRDRDPLLPGGETAAHRRYAAERYVV